MQNRLVMGIVCFLAPIITWLITVLIPGRKSAVLTAEAKNKTRIMTLVQGLASYIDPEGKTPLKYIVAKCYAMGDFPALWAVEGVGKDLAEWHMARNPEPTRMLIDADLDPSDAKSLLMLHAGIGLGFARYWVEPLKPTDSLEKKTHAVVEMIRLCRVNSIPGYAGAAIESLGLVSRFIHDVTWCREVHDILTKNDPDSLLYFWRGCGRAIYFSPQNMIPGFAKPARSIDMCAAEAPNEEVRQTLLSGVAWATTVVNMITPQVMEWVLERRADYFGDNPGYLSGVVSSVVMRYDTTPGYDLIDQFRNYKPKDPQIAKLWNEKVKASVAFAVDVAHPTLEKNQCLDQVFRYQDLPGLVKRLQAAA